MIRCPAGSPELRGAQASAMTELRRRAQSPTSPTGVRAKTPNPTSNGMSAPNDKSSSLVRHSLYSVCIFLWKQTTDNSYMFILYSPLRALRAAALGCHAKSAATRQGPKRAQRRRRGIGLPGRRHEITGTLPTFSAIHSFALRFEFYFVLFFRLLRPRPFSRLPRVPPTASCPAAAPHRPHLRHRTRAS